MDHPLLAPVLAGMGLGVGGNARRPPRPSGTPPEGGELGRGRDFAWGKSGGRGGRTGLKRDPERTRAIGLSGQ